jgi:hypothetical protein
VFKIFRFYAILILVFLTTACTHVIKHAQFPSNSTGNTGEIKLFIPPETAQKVIDKKFGINADVWKFEIGQSILDILPKALNKEYSKINILLKKPDLSDLKITDKKSDSLVVKFQNLELDLGMTVFNEHKVTLFANIEYIDKNGNAIFNHEFKSIGLSSGSSQSKTWAGLVFAPMAVSGMNNAIEVAVTNSIIQLADDLLNCINRNEC